MRPPLPRTPSSECTSLHQATPKMTLSTEALVELSISKYSYFPRWSSKLKARGYLPLSTCGAVHGSDFGPIIASEILCAVSSTDPRCLGRHFPSLAYQQVVGAVSCAETCIRISGIKAGVLAALDIIISSPRLYSAPPLPIASRKHVIPERSCTRRIQEYRLLCSRASTW